MNTTVSTAEAEDLAGYLKLAAEVEHWFGPMVNEPKFVAAVRAAINDRRALLVRDGEHVTGGLLFRHRHAVAHIDWLVVAASSRKTGIGRHLVTEVLRRTSATVVEVVTFGADHEAAQLGGARVFYERLGFSPDRPEPDGPDGGSRQRYLLHLDR
ncbi:MAG TPA: GNAT family N-acetyltransferase [Candidatus Stackebrandtia excrementipullorum]|nr:GNAT family N-acetyltransferase [Candidatus Stackebrandtia excrementipullorum]